MTLPPHCIEIGGKATRLDRIVAIGPVEVAQIGNGWRHAVLIQLEGGYWARWIGKQAIQHVPVVTPEDQRDRAEAEDWRNELIQRVWGEPPPPAPDPASACGGWRPIETVPKDGRAVLLCWAIDADGRPIDWEEEPSTAGVHVQVAAWWTNEWVVYCSMVDEPRLHFTPTHWRPLPTPPRPRGERS